jgi:hypothetical protein
MAVDVGESNISGAAAKRANSLARRRVRIGAIAEGAVNIS